MMKKMKKMVAVAVAAMSLAVPFNAEAHFLSSRQEKEIGNAAVADFKKQHRTYTDPVLTRIQERMLEWNSDKLWMYGTPGKKRGLEPILESDKDTINAVSYGGGQIIVHKPMVEFHASKHPGVYWSEKNNPQHLRPYKMSNLYQMAALASVVGHEMGHWENEDMLRMHDKEMYTKIIISTIPVGNVWALLGVAAGSNLINMFNSRQMGFRTEEQADAKGREYCEMVPEYSIGGDAIHHYRMYLYKKA
ncbi:MAG: M48 family metalloprotease, partial [Schwartzia sp.]|nr:M48 family metalloprotease [Schwartzia sp. (in: firmicutes)]